MMTQRPEVLPQVRPHVVRLVLGGYVDQEKLWQAHAELVRHGFREGQLCAFCLSDGQPGKLNGRLFPYARTINGIRLRLSSADLFDAMHLSDAEPCGKGSPWMPQRQADALWDHIRDGAPALLARAFTPDQEVACSRLLLRLQPRFLNTFNFSE